MANILEVAIGLFFIYILLSLVCTTLNEFIAYILRVRANMLRQTLANLFIGSNLFIEGKSIFDHPLLQTLNEKNKQPTYISSGTFVNTVMDLVLPAQGSDWQDLSKFKEAVIKMTDSNFKNTLLIMINKAGNDINKFQENVEKWFNEIMDRLTAWFKKRTQWLTFVVALIVTVALNVNTIDITKKLYQDPSLREKIAGQAELFVENINLAKFTGNETDLAKIKENIEFLKKEINDTKKIDFPIGWDKKPAWSFPSWLFLYNLLGWLITVFAVMLGAPFWFDILKKVMNIRSSGQKPEEIQESKQIKKGEK